MLGKLDLELTNNQILVACKTVQFTSITEAAFLAKSTSSTEPIANSLGTGMTLTVWAQFTLL